jgi:predicted acylesterase/phospholipase RssA
MEEMCYDTLVLSGASTKGIATLGSLQNLTDKGLLTEIDKFVGTSAGAMICYLLAIGYSPIEIVVHICTNQLLEKMQHFNLVGMMHGSGATSFNIIQEHLEKMTIAKIGYLPTMADIKNKLDKTLVIVTYNLTQNKTEYLSDETYPTLPCLSAIRMSCNLPLVFEKYKYGNDFYVDGGIADNFPIDMGDQIGKKVLGIVMTTENGVQGHSDTNVLELVYKLLFVPINQSVQYRIDKCSNKCSIIRLSYTKVPFFKFDLNASEKLEMFSYGYNHSESQSPSAPPPE